MAVDAIAIRVGRERLELGRGRALEQPAPARLERAQIGQTAVEGRGETRGPLFDGSCSVGLNRVRPQRGIRTPLEPRRDLAKAARTALVRCDAPDGAPEAARD